MAVAPGGHFAYTEAKQFLSKCMHPAINIILDQQPAKMDYQLKVRSHSQSGLGTDAAGCARVDSACDAPFPRG